MKNMLNEENCNNLKPYDLPPIEFKPLFCGKKLCGKECGGKRFYIMWDDTKVILKCIRCGKYHINRFLSQTSSWG